MSIKDKVDEMLKNGVRSVTNKEVDEQIAAKIKMQKSLEVSSMIEAMKAYIEGVELQSRVKGSRMWTDCSTPIWDFSKNDYRVKPKAEVKNTTITFDDGRTVLVSATALDGGTIGVKISGSRDTVAIHLI